MIWYVTAWWKEEDDILELEGHAKWVYGYEYAVVSPASFDQILKLPVGSQAFRDRGEALAHVRAQVDKEIARLHDRVTRLTERWYGEEE